MEEIKAVKAPSAIQSFICFCDTGFTILCLAGYKNITFLVGPEVSAHFFKAPETDLSQQEVYRFNVPTFGPGVVFDVDYQVRQEQFRFFTEALTVNKLKSYVDQLVSEAEQQHHRHASTSS